MRRKMNYFVGMSSAECVCGVKKKYEERERKYEERERGKKERKKINHSYM
jgi:hypothetical protein